VSRLPDNPGLGKCAVLILMLAARFTGTSVAVFGAVNSNRGTYRVTFDGSSEEYVAPLFLVSHLAFDR
jgi:hypothetical protein